METLEDRLIRHEGVKLKPYKDSRGYLTIGIGRCLDKEGITHAEALELLDNDIAAVKVEVAKALPWVIGLDDVRQSVLYEMCFQLGLDGLLSFPRMLTALRIGDYGTAASEMLNTFWHKQTPSRCEELADIMKSGEQSN